MDIKISLDKNGKDVVANPNDRSAWRIIRLRHAPTALYQRRHSTIAQPCSAIQEIEATIERGYALHKQSVPYTDSFICYDAEHRASYCHNTRMHQLETPVAVDMKQQRAKLQVLQKKWAAAQSKEAAAIQSCRYRYRE